MTWEVVSSRQQLWPTWNGDISLAVYMSATLSVGLTKKLIFYDILTVPKWNQFSQGRVWASVSWDSATCGVWVGPEHIGGWGADTAVTLGAEFPQGMPRHAASIGFMLSWLPQLLSLKAIWIFWESFQTQPSYLLGNRKHLGFWNWAPLPDRSPCSSSVGLKAHLSPQYTHLVSLLPFLLPLESGAGWKVWRWTPRSQCGFSHFNTLITIFFQGWAVITTNEQHNNFLP